MSEIPDISSSYPQEEYPPITTETPNELEIARLRGILQQWGRVLLKEGRITINDYRGAVLGLGSVGDLRENPLRFVVDGVREELKAAERRAEGLYYELQYPRD